jgi:hypothetical protein
MNWRNFLGQPEPKPPAITYTYGVKLLKKTRFRPFVIPKGALLPSHIVMQKEGQIPYDEAVALAESWAKKHRQDAQEREREKNKQPTPVPITAGTILVHNDPQGTHHAVILDIQGEDAHALFLTSKARWRDTKPRLATDSECHLFGLVPKETTYIAPVVRPLREFYAVKGQLPPECLHELQEEFAHSAV